MTATVIGAPGAGRPPLQDAGTVANGSVLTRPAWVFDNAEWLLLTETLPLPAAVGSGDYGLALTITVPDTSVSQLIFDTKKGGNTELSVNHGMSVFWTSGAGLNVWHQSGLGRTIIDASLAELGSPSPGDVLVVHVSLVGGSDGTITVRCGPFTETATGPGGDLTPTYNIHVGDEPPTLPSGFGLTGAVSAAWWSDRVLTSTERNVWASWDGTETGRPAFTRETGSRTLSAAHPDQQAAYAADEVVALSLDDPDPPPPPPPVDPIIDAATVLLGEYEAAKPLLARKGATVLPGTAGDHVTVERANLLPAGAANIAQNVSWTADGDLPTPTLTPDAAAFGGRVARFADIEPADTGQVTSPIVDVAPSTTYTAMLRLRSSKDASISVASLQGYTAATYQGERGAIPAAVDLTAGQWTWIVWTGATDVGDDGLRLRLEATTAETMTLDIDVAALQLGTATSDDWQPSWAVTGDLDVRWQATPQNASLGAADQAVFALWDPGSTERTVRVSHNEDGITVGWGLSATDRTSTWDGAGVADAQRYAGRATWTQAGDGVQRLYVDGNEVAPSAGGSDVSPTLRPAAVDLTVGALLDGSSPFAGVVEWVEVRDGIGGPVVAAYADGTSTHGEVTLNGAAAVSPRDGWLGIGGQSMASLETSIDLVNLDRDFTVALIATLHNDPAGAERLLSIEPGFHVASGATADTLYAELDDSQGETLTYTADVTQGVPFLLLVEREDDVVRWSLNDGTVAVADASAIDLAGVDETIRLLGVNPASGIAVAQVHAFAIIPRAISDGDREALAAWTGGADGAPGALADGSLVASAAEHRDVYDDTAQVLPLVVEVTETPDEEEVPPAPAAPMLEEGQRQWGGLTLGPGTPYTIRPGESGFGPVPRRTQDQPIPGGQGSIPQPHYLSGRTITQEILVGGATTAERLANLARLSTVLNRVEAAPTPFLFRHPGDTAARLLYARPLPTPDGRDGGYPVVGIVWECPDPRLYSIDEHEDVMLPYVADSGVDLPVDLPFDLGSASGGRDAIVDHDGTETAWPVLVVDVTQGTVDTVRFVNGSQLVLIEGLSLEVGDRLIFDCHALATAAPRTVLLAGQTSAFGRIVAPPRPLGLPPGRSVVRLLITGTDSPDAVGRIRWRTTSL